MPISSASSAPSPTPAPPPPVNTTGPDFTDVSAYEPGANWDTYAASGREMAVCRATKGLNLVDDTFQPYRKSLQDHNLYCGLYHFAGWPKTQVLKAPEVEADFYLDAVGPLGPKEFPILDFEQAYGLTPPQQCDWISKWCVRVEQKTGKTPWVYSNYNMAKQLKSDQLTRYPLWIAHYHTSTLPTTELWPHPIAWQFTESGTVPGVGENKVDDSHFYGDLSKIGQPATP